MSDFLGSHYLRMDSQKCEWAREHRSWLTLIANKVRRYQNLPDQHFKDSCPSEKKDVDQQPCTVILKGFSSHSNELNTPSRQCKNNGRFSEAPKDGSRPSADIIDDVIGAFPSCRKSPAGICKTNYCQWTPISTQVCRRTDALALALAQRRTVELFSALTSLFPSPVMPLVIANGTPSPASATFCA